jgi:hypothetical protein
VEGSRGRRPLWFRSLQGLALAFVVGLLVLLGWRLIERGKGGALVSAIAADRRPAAPGFELPVLWDHADTWPPPARAALGNGRVSSRRRASSTRSPTTRTWSVLTCRRHSSTIRSQRRSHRRLREARFRAAAGVRRYEAEGLKSCRSFTTSSASRAGSHRSSGPSTPGPSSARRIRSPRRRRRGTTHRGCNWRPASRQ